MADYKKMYFTLFNKVTDIIEELQKVQRETEALYINSEQPQLFEIKPENKDQ